uniref:E3 ubiquitin protein ligase n=1 Tax=Poecilia latipinna TaxID=48699 RepID=A0A3B3VTF7_9TELE
SKTKTNLNGFLKSELCPGSAGGSVRLRRKLEKQKKVEVYSDADEILQEEINQYKVRRNDRLVDRLCFHVFCYECLKMRYDTRQRKCPKCNCAFGRKKGETEPKGRRDQRGEQEDCRFTQTFLIFGKDSFYQIVFHLFKTFPPCFWSRPGPGSAAPVPRTGLEQSRLCLFVGTRIRLEPPAEPDSCSASFTSCISHRFRIPMG